MSFLCTLRPEIARAIGVLTSGTGACVRFGAWVLVPLQSAAVHACVHIWRGVYGRWRFGALEKPPSFDSVSR